MTLDQIQHAGPEFRAVLQKSVGDKNIQLILNAVRKDITSRIGRVPVPQQGQTYDGAVSNWHSCLHGMQTVVSIIENIGKETPGTSPPNDPEEAPFEHGIEPRLVEARKKGFKK